MSVIQPAAPINFNPGHLGKEGYKNLSLEQAVSLSSGGALLFSKKFLCDYQSIVSNGKVSFHYTFRTAEGEEVTKTLKFHIGKNTPLFQKIKTLHLSSRKNKDVLIKSLVVKNIAYMLSQSTLSKEPLEKVKAVFKEDACLKVTKGREDISGSQALKHVSKKDGQIKAKPLKEQLEYLVSDPKIENTAQKISKYLEGTETLSTTASGPPTPSSSPTPQTSWVDVFQSLPVDALKEVPEFNAKLEEQGASLLDNGEVFLKGGFCISVKNFVELFLFPEQGALSPFGEEDLFDPSIQGPRGGICQGGNTCYLAAAFQQIAHIERFHSQFQKDPKQIPGEEKKAFENRTLLIQSARTIIEKVQKGISVPSDEINTFREVMEACEFHFFDETTSQYDSSEFLIWILEKANPKRSIHLDLNSHLQSFDFKSTSKKRDPIDRLSVPISKEETTHLSGFLEEFFKEETLTGEEQYDFETGKGKEDAKKHVRLSSFPDLLPIDLKRFAFDRKEGRGFKITKDIEMPEELEIPGKWVEGKEGQTQRYRLASFIMHTGNTPNSGHYYSWIKIGEEWVCADDGRVRKAAESYNNFEHDRKKGYAYFYEKVT